MERNAKCIYFMLIEDVHNYLYTKVRFNKFVKVIEVDKIFHNNRNYLSSTEQKYLDLKNIARSV
jgi:hypothetical protein